MNVELHSNAKLKNKENAHSDFEISTHEREAKTPDRDAHNDTEVERQNRVTRTKPRLSKYVKRHHLVDQIIGDKDARPMKKK